MPLLTTEIRQLIDRQRLCFVATVCADGTPNVSPKSTLCVLDDDHLMFADIRSPGTVANLRRNPAIEINVVDALTRKGYRFKGMATVLESGEPFTRYVESFGTRGMSDAPRRISAIVVMQVKQVRALVSPGYDQGISEAGMRAQWTRHYFPADIQ